MADTRPCIKCGSIDRNPNDGRCRRCHAERSKRQYEARKNEISKKRSARQKSNPEINRERMRAWRQANKERHIEYRKKYHAENKDRANKISMLWARNNKEKVAVYRQNRRAHTQGEKLSKSIVMRLIEEQKNKCAYCKTKLNKFHVDHIIPLSKGGRNVDSNVQLLCPNCNFSKGAKDPIDFMRERGFLL
jgi:5-methylcytosine-specific restriction endonuclease McrA